MIRHESYRPIAVTSQILRVSSRCSLTISVRVQQPHTAQKLTVLIQNYYKVFQNLLCLQKLYYDASSPALWRHVQWVYKVAARGALRKPSSLMKLMKLSWDLRNSAWLSAASKDDQHTLTPTLTYAYIYIKRLVFEVHNNNNLVWTLKVKKSSQILEQRPVGGEDRYHVLKAFLIKTVVINISGGKRSFV
jgi:hypothetical protein